MPNSLNNQNSLNKQSAETARMLQLISGFHVSRALHVAAQLGLPDLVEQGQSTVSQLAASTLTDAPSLQRLLRVLASVGVFEIDADQRVQMTELARTLLAHSPHSLRAWAIDQLGGEHYQAWGALMDSVRSGRMGFELAFGQRPWQHRADHPESARAFDAGMSSFLQAHLASILAALPLSKVNCCPRCSAPIRHCRRLCLNCRKLPRRRGRGFLNLSWVHAVRSSKAICLMTW
jgi:Dimerisation domain